MKKNGLKIFGICNTLIFIVTFGLIGQVAASGPMYFCIGEKDFNCEIRPVYDCGTNADGVAQGLCTATTPQGPKPLPYLLSTIAVHDGNKCGYHMYRVECVTGASLAKLKNDSETMSKFKKLEDSMSIKAANTEK